VNEVDYVEFKNGDQGGGGSGGRGDGYNPGRSCNMMIGEAVAWVVAFFNVALGVF